MSSSFAKKLADSDARVRDKAFVAVSKWLAGRESLDELDARKLWRGLFYSFWHADGRATQLDVADKMGALMHALNREVAMSYAWACMWTMRTEWSGIDKHRMDKFCLLSRRVFHHALRFAGERRWDSTERLRDVLADGVFADASRGIGFKLHVAETFLREMDAVCKGESGLEMDDGEARAGAPTPIPSSALATLLMVFVRAMETEESQVLLRRIREDVFEPLCDPSRATENPRAARLTPSGLKTLCETAISLGARDGVEDVCRENLYELHGMLKRGASKITKDAEARGVDPEAEDVEAASPPKKKKKEKKAKKNGVATPADDSADKKTKKKKEKKMKRAASDEASDDELKKREKKRRKKERRLAKEAAAAAAERAEKEDADDDAPKTKKKKSKTSAHDDVRDGSKMVAMRALVDRGSSASPTPSLDSLDSPSMSPRTRRLMWNDDGITYSSPDARAPINTAKGKRNLRMTPTKTIFRPIHGKTYSAPPKSTKSRLSHGGGKKRAAESFF